MSNWQLVNASDFFLDTFLCHCLARFVHAVSNSGENTLASSGQISGKFEAFLPLSYVSVAACVSRCGATAVHPFTFPIHNVVGSLCAWACESLFAEKARLFLQKLLLMRGTLSSADSELSLKLGTSVR